MASRVGGRRVSASSRIRATATRLCSPLRTRFRPCRRAAGFGWRLLGFVLDNILINIVVSFIVSAVGLNSMLSGAAFDRWARELVLYSEGTATGPLPMPDNELWLAILYSSLLKPDYASIAR